jgi:hypothetical protein
VLGNSAQALLSDGNGVLYWGAPSAVISGGQLGFATRWLTTSSLTTSTIVDNGTVVGVNASSSLYAFNVQSSSSTVLNPFNVASSSGVSFLSVSSRGYIGIGTTTPTDRLVISGNTTPFSDLSGSLGSSTLRFLNLFAQNIFATSSTITNASSTNVTVAGSLYSSLTSGSVPFIGTSGLLTQDNSNFFFDNTNKRLGIGTNAPTATLSLASTTANGSSNLFNIATSSTLFAVQANGNVGIGVPTPGELLDINGGNVRVTNSVNASALWTLYNTNTGTGADARFAANNGQANTYFALEGSNVASSAYFRPNESLMFSDGAGLALVSASTTGTSDIQFWTGGSNQRGVITKLGYFGIGVTAPTDMLQVAGNITPSADLSGSLGSSTLRFLNLFAQNIFATSSTITNASSTSISAIGATLTSAFITNETVTNGTTTLFAASRASTTNFTATNATATLFAAGSASTTNFFATNATTTLFASTNASTTNFFATNATATLAAFGRSSTTNFFATNATATLFAAGNASTTNFFGTNASTTNLSATGATISALFVSDLDGINASSTNATIASNLYLSTLTKGSVIFTGTSGALTQDNTKFFWDATNGRLGVGTSTPYAVLNVASSTANGTSELFAVGSSSPIFTVFANGKVGIGTTSPVEQLDVAGGVRLGNTTALNMGTMRFTGSDFEGYDGSVWRSMTSATTTGGTVISYAKTLASDVSPAVLTNSASSTNMYTYTIPGGTLSTNKIIRLVLQGAYYNNSGATRTITATVRYGGVTVATRTSAALNNGATPGGFNIVVYLSADNSTQLQTTTFNAVAGVIGDSSAWAGGGTSTIDSTVNQDLSIDLQHSAANASLYVTESFANVELVNATDAIRSQWADNTGGSINYAAGSVSVGTSTASTTRFFVQGASGSANNLFTVASSSGTSFFSILANGNTGIGSSSPVSQFSVNSVKALTSDLSVLTNVNNAVTTAGISNLRLSYFGGAAAVEASAQTIDLTPGTTAGGIWNGLRLNPVAGSLAGITQSMLKIESPATFLAGGIWNGINMPIVGSGTATGTITALNIGSITGGSATETALLIGTGWDAAINIGTTTASSSVVYIGGTSGSGKALLTVASSTSSTLFTVLANGKVGIGTSTPTATLAVQGLNGATNPFAVASSSGAELLTLNSNGNFGIGSSTPGANLAVVGSAGQIAFIVASSSGAVALSVNAAGYVGVGTTTSVAATTTVPLRVAGDVRIGTFGTNGCIQGNGGATISGTCISDQNLKTNITDITDLATRFQSLRAINFNWNTVAESVYGNNVNDTNTGYLAQNIESLFPELIHVNAQGFKEVNYAAMGIYTAEAVKELSIASASASSTLSSLATTVANNYTDASTTIATLATTVAAQAASISSLSSTITSLTNVVGVTSATGSFATLNIDAIGNVGIGTTTPTEKLDLLGNLRVGSSTGLSLFVNSTTGVVGIGNDGTALGDEKLRVSGRVRATGFDIDSAADLAENFPASEVVDAGTVIAFATTTTDWTATKSGNDDDTYQMTTIRKAVTGYEAAGIVSTNAGILLGSKIANGVPVAFSGRVPVKVTTENGEIKAGDYLTVSKTIPGYAMKLTGEGRSIGRALSDYVQGHSKVLVLVDNGYQKLDITGKYASTTAMLTTGNVDLDANGVSIINIKSLASANGTWSIDEHGRITVKELCVGDNCVDGQGFADVIATSKKAGSLQVVGNYTYILNAKAQTLTVLDISNATPALVTTLTVTGNMTSLSVSGNYLYLTNDNLSKITLIDISNPSAPSIARNIDTTGGVTSSSTPSTLTNGTTTDPFATGSGTTSPNGGSNNQASSTDTTATSNASSTSGTSTPQDPVATTPAAGTSSTTPVTPPVDPVATEGTTTPI